jgi:hypothetical protein
MHHGASSAVLCLEFNALISAAAAAAAAAAGSLQAAADNAPPTDEAQETEAHTDKMIDMVQKVTVIATTISMPAAQQQAVRGHESLGKHTTDDTSAAAQLANKVQEVTVIATATQQQAMMSYESLGKATHMRSQLGCRVKELRFYAADRFSVSVAYIYIAVNKHKVSCCCRCSFCSVFFCLFLLLVACWTAEHALGCRVKELHFYAAGRFSVSVAYIEIAVAQRMVSCCCVCCAARLFCIAFRGFGGRTCQAISCSPGLPC